MKTLVKAKQKFCYFKILVCKGKHGCSVRQVAIFIVKYKF